MLLGRLRRVVDLNELLLLFECSSYVSEKLFELPGE